MRKFKYRYKAFILNESHKIYFKIITKPYYDIYNDYKNLFGYEISLTYNPNN